MGLLQMQTGRAEAAVAFLQRAIELDPASAAYHSNLGAVQRMLKRTDEAVASFRRALACGPPPAELCNNLCCALKDSGQIDDALGWFDEAARLRPISPMRISIAAICFWTRGDWTRRSIAIAARRR